MSNAARWKQLISWLHRTFPANYPVMVRSIDKVIVEGKWRDADGPYQASCDFDNGQFRIEIRKGMCWSLLKDAAVHEWAHALTWQGAEADEEHSSEWGIAYAKIYREYEVYREGHR